VHRKGSILPSARRGVSTSACPAGGAETTYACVLQSLRLNNAESRTSLGRPPPVPDAASLLLCLCCAAWQNLVAMLQGAERAVRVPRDLERFRELPMLVAYRTAAADGAAAG
jgi:hypothetical protein